MAAGALGGCGQAEGITAGGVVPGDTLTVYSLLPLNGPQAPVARDFVDGQKLALSQSAGKAGGFDLTFAAVDIAARPAGEVAREAIKDPAVIALVADLDSRSARSTIPLLNAAGLLHVSPGATYTGFVARTATDDPGRWQPARRRSFDPLPPPDVEQARALAAVARPPVAVESESTPAAEALAAAVRSQLRGRLTDDARRARTVVYAGDDPEDAAGVIDGLRRENPRARILLGEALLRAGVRPRRRVHLLASAPPPGPGELDGFEPAFGRCPGPYALLGWHAMRHVIDAIEQAGERAASRSAVIDAWFSRPREPYGARAPWYVVEPGGSPCRPRYRPVS